jgi:hypothetical protein
MIKLISIKKYEGSGNSRYTATFNYTSFNKNKKVSFGDRRYDNYTIHKDDERKRLYLLRHAGGNEEWNNPMTKGSLSRWILWNKKTLNESIDDFKKRFKI